MPTPSIDLLWFLTLGFLGGFGHCVGMCAPFVLLVSRRFVAPDAGRRAAFGTQLWYTGGRVLTYAVLGALAAGAAAFLTKPFDGHELLDTIAAQLALGRPADVVAAG